MNKYFIPAFVAMLLAVSCVEGQYSGYNTRKEALEAAEKENEQLKLSLGDLQGRYAAQNRELAAILHELSAISYNTASLRLNVEGAPENRSMVDSVFDNIAVVKARIDKLEKEAARARKLDKDLAVSVATINELRATVSNQEKQISVLKKKISEHENTIRAQENKISSHESTISRQADTIHVQRDKIAETVLRQREMLYQAGVEFENIADEGDFQVTGRKNRRNISGYRRAIYEQALMFYSEAASQGHAKAAVRAAVVENKLREI